MKALPVLFLLSIALFNLSACSKLDAPTPGAYRAHVTLNGGEAPFELRVNQQNGRTLVAIVHDDQLQPATGVIIKDGRLVAQLPDASGTLNAEIQRDELKGELQLTDPQGKVQHLPFIADLNRHYRFLTKPSTDNADVSGYWELQTNDAAHFTAPLTLKLEQHFDAVDGELKLSDNQVLQLIGQANGDELYLSALGHGRATLFKGRVTSQGELQGYLWSNLGDAQPWHARRLSDKQVAALSNEADQARQVALPWNIPTQTPAAEIAAP